MGDVIDFERVRYRRRSHLSGMAKCGACQHSWVAVVPLGTTAMECPNCQRYMGFMTGHVQRGGVELTCNCNCSYFKIDPKGAYCISCGVYQTAIDIVVKEYKDD